MSRSRVAVVLPALLAPLALAPPALALNPIDDFESGGFSFSSSSGYQAHVVPIPVSSSHAIAPQRRIVLAPDGGVVSAQSTLYDSNHDDVLQVLAEGNGSVRVEWDLGFVRDLTFLGQVDRFVVDMESAPEGGQITAILVGPGGGEGVTKPTNGGQTLEFHFSEWGFADPTAVETIAFRFDAADGYYRVAEIRLRRTGSLDVNFLGMFVATQVPPIPSPPLEWRTHHLSLFPLVTNRVVIQDAVSESSPQFTADWEEVAFGRSVTSFRGADSKPFWDTTFRISVDFTGSRGNVCMAYPPDPIHDERGFLLEFPIVVVAPGGAVVGESLTRWHFDVDPRQGAIFPYVTVTPGLGASNGFEITFDCTAAGGVDTVFPLFDATWISDWNLTQVTDAPAPGPVAAPVPMLRARPSVTRGGTEVVASRPFGAGARIVVHDVAGRRVRTIHAPQGARTVRWDGDGADGAAPAGVYFLQLEDAAGRAAARVTRVR